MPEPFKYLAIKNWDKYQSAKQNCTWVKDYVEKDFDPDFSGLTLSQKGMLDACCRLRARRGCNLENKPLWICSAVAIKAQERHNAVAAIGQLIDSGFLVLTNEQHSSLDKSREDKKREDIKPEAEVPKPAPQKPQTISPEASSGLKAVMYLPLNSGEEFAITEEDFKVWKETYQAVNILQELQKMVAWLHSNPTKKKTRSGVKRFVNSWLSRAQDNPKAASMFAVAPARDGPIGTVDASETIRERQEKLKAFKATNGKN